MTVTMIVRALAMWLQQHCLLRLETKLALATSSRFLWHVLRLPMYFFTQRSSGDLGFRVAANDRVAFLLSGQLATTALSLITSVFFLAVLFAYDRVLALVAFAMAALNFVALRAVARQRVDGNQKLLVDRGILYAPDYVVNAGGVIQVADEIDGFDFERAKARAEKIYDTTRHILEQAAAEGVPPSVAADRLAEQRMADARR